MIAKKLIEVNVVRRKDAKGINSADNSIWRRYGTDSRMHPHNAVEEVNRLFLETGSALQAKRGLQSATAVEERLRTSSCE